MKEIQFTQSEFDNAVKTIEEYAYPILPIKQIHFNETVPIEDQTYNDDQYYIPPATLKAKLFTILFQFLNDIALLIFKDGQFKKPSIFKIGKFIFIVLKMIGSIIQACKNG